MRKATSLLLTLCMVFALCACGSGGGSVSSNREKDLDPLCVEDVSFEPATSDSYNMRIKVRNNDIPYFKDRTLINVVIYFQLLDASGNGLPANISFIESWSEFPNLPVGQSCWTTSKNAIDKAAVDAAERVQFTS